MPMQVGGTHYVAQFQHWDMVAFTHSDYLSGNATKYLGRWRKKNGAEDIAKAMTYGEKMLELASNGDLYYRNNSLFIRNPVVAHSYLRKWFESAAILFEDQEPITRVLTWQTPTDLVLALGKMRTQMRGAGGPTMPPATLPPAAPLQAPTGPRQGPPGATPGRGVNHPAPFGYQEDSDAEV